MKIETSRREALGYKPQTLSMASICWSRGTSPVSSSLRKTTSPQQCQLPRFDCCCKKESQKNPKIGISTALCSPAFFTSHISYVFTPNTIFFSPQCMLFSAERRFNSPLRDQDTRSHKRGGDGEVWDSPPDATQRSGTIKQRLHGRGVRPRGRQQQRPRHASSPSDNPEGSAPRCSL